jgi:tripartite-type tricarboxylate transporter receptor subunit TctC
MRLLPRFVLPALALALATFGAGAQQQALRIVVPYSPGGSSDVLARAFSVELAKALGENVIVDNRPGAGSLLATQYVATQPADGRTLLLVDVPFAIVPALYRERVRYDVQKDFVPVSLIGESPTYLFVNEASPLHSAGDLVKSAQARPSTITIASGGNGSLTHLMAELFMINTRTRLVHVPYKGAAGAITDVAAGHVQAIITTMASAGGLYPAGRVRALAVSAPQRHPETPNVPTFEEAGVPGMNVESWWGVVVRAGTSPADQGRLRDAMHQVLSQPAVRARIRNAGVDVPADTSADALRKTVSADVVRWREVIERANIHVE